MNDTTRTCSYFRAQLSALLDDELGRSEKSATEEHLASCSPCAAEFRSLSAMTGELASLPRAAVGAEFLVELRRRLDSDTQPESASWAEGLNWFRVNLTLGTAMTVAIGLVAFRSDSVREAARAPGASAAVSDRALIAQARGPQTEQQAAVLAETVRKDADALAGGQTAAPADTLASDPAPAVPAPAAAPAAPVVVARAPAGAALVPEADSFQAEDDAVEVAEGSVLPASLESADRRGAAPAASAPAAEPKRAAVREKAKKRAELASSNAVDMKKEAAASPAAPAESAGLARSTGLNLGGAEPASRRAQPSQAGESFDAPRALPQDMAALKQGLQVGDLSGGRVDSFAPSEARSRSDLLAKPGAGGSGLGEMLHATPGRLPASDDEQSQDKAAEAGSLDPSLTGDSQAVTHALLSHYFGTKAVETPEQATRSRSDGSIVIKVTRLRAFLRALRAEADAMSLADFQATSASSFEFSVMVEGGQAGLEAVTAKLSSFPGAQPAGLMFERLGEGGRFAARVMVTVAPE